MTNEELIAIICRLVFWGGLKPPLCIFTFAGKLEEDRRGKQALVHSKFRARFVFNSQDLFAYQYNIKCLMLCQLKQLAQMATR